MDMPIPVIDSTTALLNERSKTHGDYSDHARVTQSLKWVVKREKKWGDLADTQREAIEMILHKIGRIMAGNANYKDHWDDIAGYAKLVSDRIKIGTNTHDS